MDAIRDQDYNVTYKVFVHTNNKIYIIEPSDIGDWYQVGLIVDLMNLVTSDAGHQERFEFIETGGQDVQFLFGPPGNLKQFIEKYGL